MAQGSYTTDLATLTQNETNTGMAEPTASGWTSLNVAASAETDYFIQNASCTSATVKVGVGGLMYNNGAGFTIPTDGAVFCWAYFWAPGVLAVESSGGARQMIGSSLADFYYVNHLGSDSWLYGGWQCLAMADPGAITTDTQVGTPTATRQYTGWAYNAPSAVPGKGNPYGIDAIRYGRGTLQITDGDVTEYGTFAAAAEFNDKNSTAARTGFTLLDSGYHRLGLFQYQDGAYKWQGHFLMGTTGALVDFRDSNRLIFVLNTKHVTANFNLFEVRNAGSYVDWTGITIIALGTVSRGRFLVTDNADVNLSSCTFTDMDTFTFMAASAALNCTFRRTNAVTAPGSNLTGSTFETPTVAADASAVVWNVAINPTGLLDDTTFSKGTNAHHAINFGASAPQTITLNGISFTGFNASHEQNDSTLLFSDTGGNVTWTVNLAGCSGNISYKKVRAGDTVDLVSNPVSLSIHVQDINTTTAIVGARVWVPVTSTASGRPFNQTIDSISAPVSGVSTVTFAAAHNLVTNDYLHISGCDQPEYNKTFQVTKTGATTLEIGVTGSPGASSGTEVGKWVIISGVTNGSGDISASYTYAASQSISGRVRLSTNPSYYKTAPISGTVNSSSGLALTILMIPDS